MLFKIYVLFSEAQFIQLVHFVTEYKKWDAAIFGCCCILLLSWIHENKKITLFDWNVLKMWLFFYLAFILSPTLKCICFRSIYHKKHINHSSVWNTSFFSTLKFFERICLEACSMLEYSWCIYYFFCSLHDHFSSSKE